MTHLTRKYLSWLAVCISPLLAAYLGIVVFAQPAFAPGTLWGWALMGLAGLGIVALVTLSVVLASRLLRPLDRLAADLSATTGIEELPAGSDSDLGAVAQSINQLKQSLTEVTESRDYLRRLLGSISDAILVTDRDGRITCANNAAAELLDYPRAELVGRSVRQLIDIELAAKVRPGERAARSSDGTFSRRDGITVPVSYTVAELRDNRGVLDGWIIAAQNCAERRRAENRVKFLARTDPLTKMSNRMQFQHQLQQNIARSRRSHQSLALLYIDIDRFKDINDTLGHGAGDRALEIFAQRIITTMPDSTIAGRLAGDEFAIIIGQLDRLGDAIDRSTELARTILQAVGSPFRIEAQEIFVSASIGIAIYPRDADNVIDLLRNADAALYQAKRAGGNCFEIYSEDMTSAAVDRLMLKSKLRRAFERNELRLHYQPKYALSTGKIAGAEALVRWEVPDKGLVYPSDFIPIAEESNLILQLGDWVFNQVCRDYRYWQSSLAAPNIVSLNLSLKQLQQHRFLEKLQGIFRAHSVSPTCLELEITETTLMDDAKRTIQLLNALYSMGLHLTIDDFGTGYSSLSALQQFPISTLKIDQSFIRDLPIDKDDAAIVNAIINMAHSLGLEVVAEGVESDRQLELLRRSGCDYVQGHLFGDPMTADELLESMIQQAEGSGRYTQLFA